MLFSDFAASGGVLGVTLDDAVHPLLGPDLPQPPQPKLPSANIMIPDLPQPTQPPLPRLGIGEADYFASIGTPDPPQPPQPRLGTAQLAGVVNFGSPDPPQPTPPAK